MISVVNKIELSVVLTYSPPELLEDDDEGTVAFGPMLSWAIGCLSYWIVSGKTPFWDTCAELIAGNITEKPPGDLSGEISVSVASVIVELLQKEPDSRLSVNCISSRVAEASKNSMYFFPPRQQKAKSGQATDKTSRGTRRSTGTDEDGLVQELKKQHSENSCSTGSLPSTGTSVEISVDESSHIISPMESHSVSSATEEAAENCSDDVRHQNDGNNEEGNKGDCSITEEEPNLHQADESIVSTSKQVSESGATKDAELRNTDENRQSTEASETKFGNDERPVKSLPCSFDDIAVSNAEEFTKDTEYSQTTIQNGDDMRSIEAPETTFANDDRAVKSPPCSFEDIAVSNAREESREVSNTDTSICEITNDGKEDICEDNSMYHSGLKSPGLAFTEETNDQPEKDGNLMTEDFQPSDKCSKSVESRKGKETKTANQQKTEKTDGVNWDERPIKGLQQSFEDIAASHGTEEVSASTSFELLRNQSTSKRSRTGINKGRKSMGTAACATRKIPARKNPSVANADSTQNEAVAQRKPSPQPVKEETKTQNETPRIKKGIQQKTYKSSAKTAPKVSKRSSCTGEEQSKKKKIRKSLSKQKSGKQNDKKTSEKSKQAQPSEIEPSLHDNGSPAESKQKEEVIDQKFTEYLKAEMDILEKTLEDRAGGTEKKRRSNRSSFGGHAQATKAGRAQAVVEFAQQSVSQVTQQVAAAQASRKQSKDNKAKQLKPIEEEKTDEDTIRSPVLFRDGTNRKSDVMGELPSPVPGGRHKTVNAKKSSSRVHGKRDKTNHDKKVNKRHSLASNARKDMKDARNAIGSSKWTSHGTDEDKYGDDSLSSLQNSLSELIDSFKATENAWLDSISG